MDGPSPPPPPPPHGEKPQTTDGEYRKSSDLPQGNYDIFIIPPHSAGAGFVYLPSLQCNQNSFIAGVASTLLVVAVWSMISPIFRSWYIATFYPSPNPGGNSNMVMILSIVMGLAGCLFGASQWKSGPGCTSGSSSKPQSSGHQRSGSNYNGQQKHQQDGDFNQQSRDEQQHQNTSHNGPDDAERERERERDRERDKERDKEREREREREEAKRKEELRKKMDEFKRKREAEAKEKERAREREVMEKELKERREQLEREMAAAKAATEKEARERLEKEAFEARLKQAKETAEARAKAAKAIAEAKAEAARLAAEAEERAAKDAAEKEAAAKASAQKEAMAKFAALKEAATKRYAEKKAEEERENAKAKAASAKSPSASIPRTTSPTKPPPFPTARTTVEDDDQTYVFRPYDRPRRPYAGSSAYSESSYAPSQSTARTTPPPSNRGAYATKDPDKIVIQGVYAFNHAFNKTPIAQLVSGQGMVTDGLVLRITTEGLFIDDEVRGVGQREWDIKAWTLKLAEVWCPSMGNNAKQGSSNHFSFRRGTQVPTNEESEAVIANLLKVCKNTCRLVSPSKGAAGLHVLRASVRDQEGKQYVFVLPDTEAWKVAIGLQRIRAGALVRSLGVSAMAVPECKKILGELGYM